MADKDVEASRQRQMANAMNRTAIQGPINPLFSKFVTEGEQPSTYITADKRREIYDFM